MLSRRALLFCLAILLCLSSLLSLKNPSRYRARRVHQPPPDVPHRPPNLHETRPPLEPIVFAFVFIGGAAAHEGLIAIKSAIIHSSRPLDIHVICTEEAQAIVEAPFQLITHPYYDLRVTLHVITPERVQERLRRAEIGLDPGFLTKLLLHEVLVGVEKAIFVDSDMIFVVDPVQLWNTFDTLDDQTLIALPDLGPNSHAGEICSCIMLLRLDRMREPSPSSPTFLIPTPNKPSLLGPLLREAARTGIPSYQGADPPGTLLPFDPIAPPFGDQGIIWILWRARPELFARLGLQWDVTYCRAGYGLRLAGKVEMAEEEHVSSQVQTNGRDLVVPGILHFNCQRGSNVWTLPENHDGQSMSWAPLVEMAVSYKWVWLNRGTQSHSGRMKIDVQVGVRWLDEPDDMPPH